MKKVFWCLGFLFVSSLCFAETWKEAKEAVLKFIESGTYMTYNSNEDTVYYVMKSCITGIKIDEDDIEITTGAYNIMTGKQNDSFSYSMKKYEVETDENCNLIIKRK